MRKALLIFLIFPTLILTACDESLYDYRDTPVVLDEATATQVTLQESRIQPILTKLELPPEITSYDEWPVDVLPEEFPIMDFTSITNVSASFDPSYGYNDDSSIYPEVYPVFIYGTATLEQLSSFKQDLKENSFEKPHLRSGADMEMYKFVDNNLLFSDKNCIIIEKYFNEKTGLYSIELYFSWLVKYYDPTGGRGWPDYNTDLGLEEIVFDEWPREYLPEGFPEPAAVDIASMEQKKNGLFITFHESFNTLKFFIDQLYKSGYKKVGSSAGITDESPDRYKAPMFNSNYDRYTVHSEFIDMLDAPGTDIHEYMDISNEFDYKEQHITFQIIKGEDTIKYWEALGEE